MQGIGFYVQCNCKEIYYYHIGMYRDIKLNPEGPKYIINTFVYTPTGMPN